MPIKVSRFESLLQSKFGFVEASSRSKDHKWYEIILPGMPPIVTKVSHGRGEEIGHVLERKIAAQLRVSVSVFRDMIQCTCSCEQYYQLMQTNPKPHI